MSVNVRVIEGAGNGMPGVVVSDGLHVERTDEGGKAQLPGDGRFIMCTRPTGWSGVWWVPNPPAGEHVLFELSPEPQGLPYRFIHLTDTHVSVPPPDFAVHPDHQLVGGSELSQLLTKVANFHPDAQRILITGDLTNAGVPEEFEQFHAALLTSSMPVDILPGNHDHMGGIHARMVSRNGYQVNQGTTEGYESYLGPRWWSADIAGLHVVAFDWHSWELGLDHRRQTAWLQADLSHSPSDVPWVLLAHDQPSTRLLEELPSLPIATISGHWHASRVIEHQGVLHINTPPQLFTGLDYSPPAWRVITWDGSTLSLDTVVDAPAPLRGAGFRAGEVHSAGGSLSWSAQAAGGTVLAGGVVDGDHVLVATSDDDHATGWVEAFVLSDGVLAWKAELGRPIKVPPAVAGNVVIARTVAGDLVGLDRNTGEALWQRPTEDSMWHWAWFPPITDGKVVVAGDQTSFICVSAADGQLIWSRDDLGPHLNLVSHGYPSIVGTTVVVGFWPTLPRLLGLDLESGHTLWTQAEPEPDTGPQPSYLGPSPVGPIAADFDSRLVYFSVSGALRCVEADTGSVRWVAPTKFRFHAGKPVLIEDLVVATVAGHGVMAFDRWSGETRADIALSGVAPIPFVPYRRIGHPALAGPTMTSAGLMVPGTDGEIRAVDLREGTTRSIATTGAPIAAPLADAGSGVIAVDVCGGVHFLQTVFDDLVEDGAERAVRA